LPLTERDRVTSIRTSGWTTRVAPAGRTSSVVVSVVMLAIALVLIVGLKLLIG